MTSLEIEQKKIDKKSILHNLEIIVQAIYPYLTEKGKAEYKNLNRR
ncbi:hypothetical protein GCM10007940_45730 [Portibacter lacus]|uniref:Uncharacterized protein n=1 Tax=Portibacter lacus TaxID=1099794 RepID=A0AA37STJ1_9BACT|nr:hypothetical protein GCM10007940_45730 [Portibacter lacus]